MFRKGINRNVACFDYFQWLLWNEDGSLLTISSIRMLRFRITMQTAAIALPFAFVFLKIHWRSCCGRRDGWMMLELRVKAVQVPTKRAGSTADKHFDIKITLATVTCLDSELVFFRTSAFSFCLLHDNS